MADFSLGEAIGLRGRFNMADQVAGYAAKALGDAAKARALRAKQDKELYEDLDKSIKPPKDLHPLFQEPAAQFTADFLASLRDYKKEGTLSSRGYRLVDNYSQLMAEIKSKSDRMTRFDDSYDKSFTYKSQAQKDIRAASANSRNLYDFTDKIRDKKIPGYDADNYDFSMVDGQPSLAIFQEKRDIESDIKDRMSRLTEVNIPPSSLSVGGQDMIQYGSQVFFSKKQAEDWQSLNPGKEIPTSVEDQVDALMEDEDFVFQFADSRGYTFQDTDRIKKDLMEMAKGYAEEDINYKNKNRDTNIYINTSEKPTMSQLKFSGVLENITNRKQAFALGGINMTNYNIESAKLNLTAGSVNDEGIKVTSPMANAKLTNTIIYPTVVVGGVEKPIIKENGKYNSIDPKDINSFRLYTVFTSESGQRRYVPYDEIYGQLAITKLPNDQLSRFNVEISKQQNLELKLRGIHKNNRNNPNFELYKHINDYLSKKSIDSQEPLNKYLQSLAN